MALNASGIVVARGAFRLDVAHLAADESGTALVGRNGAGKTTMLLALQGLIAHGGAVHRPLRCAGVFAQPAVLRGTVRWNVEIVLRSVLGLTSSEARELAHAMLASVDLERLGERDARRLSSGERQRLAFARALSLEPQALFLDEAFANVDADGRIALRTLVREYVVRTNCALVIATQTLADITALCKRVVVLEQGYVELDAPFSVSTLTAHPYLAALAGEAAVAPAPRQTRSDYAR